MYARLLRLHRIAQLEETNRRLL
jgi:hypothetical protein